MLNGINNNELLLNGQLDRQSEAGAVTTNPIKNNPYSKLDKSLLIDETAISSEAVNLYEKEQEVKKFNTLAMSDPENMSHDEIIANLFSKGVLDPLADNVITQLSQNEDLFKDLSL